MTRRVFLHIGAPKTGTTYLQERLAANPRTLADHDVHFPGRTALSSQPLFHFRAALDLLGEDWGGPAGHAEGAWPAMVRRVGRFGRSDSTIIISHEILAPAPPDAIARAKKDLLGVGDVELHILYTARDIGRQIPAAWQESIKQGRIWPYRRFLRKVKKSGNPWFARAFDLPSVLAAWSSGLPPEHVHVVTVPPRGAPRDLLWHRFCEAVGIDPSWAPIDVTRANPSLGVVETEVIRKLNRRIDYSTRRHTTFDQLIREKLANTEFSGSNGGSAPVRLPPRLDSWAEAQAERWIEWLEGSGVRVVGEIDDLRPVPLAEGEKWVNPDKVAPKVLSQVAIDALAAMTREAARRPDPDLQLTNKVRTQLARRRADG